MFGKRKYNRKEDEVPVFINGELSKMLNLASLARDKETAARAYSEHTDFMRKVMYRVGVFYSPMFIDERQVDEVMSLVEGETELWAQNNFMPSSGFIAWSARMMGTHTVVMKQLSYPYSLKEKEQFWIDFVETGIVPFTEVREAWKKKQDNKAK